MYSLAVLSTLLATALSATIPKPNVNYDGYKVVRLISGKDTKEISSIVDELKLDTWQFPKTPGANVDIVVPPKKLSEFEKLASSFKSQVMHEDLGKSIASEGVFSRYESGSANDTWFESYHSFDDHIKYLKDIQAAHPDNSAIVSAGKSFEDRDITGIHLWGSGGKGKNPAVVFHGTVHAREWISTMVSEYILNQLFEEDSKDILDKLDFHIFPVVNPDGFVYTETDRMWRKSRQTTDDGDCVGTDLNRNWPFGWEGDGSSPDPCDETFRGAEAGDAPETKGHISYIQKLIDGAGLKLFIDWHSYSQLFMTPFGYDCDERAPNDTLLQKLAKTFAQALEAVHGTTYETGPICSTIYQTNGNSVDWAVDAGGEAGFAAELRDTGANGFVLPPEEIQPSGEETWAGLKKLLTDLLAA